MLRPLIGAVILALVSVQAVAQTSPVEPEAPLNLSPNPVPAPTPPQAPPTVQNTNQYPTYTGSTTTTGTGQPPDTNRSGPPQ
jgi:hypothetical protein